MKYRVRILSRGDGAEPLPNGEQLAVYDAIHTARPGKFDEWAPGLLGHLAVNPALIIEDAGLPPTENGMAFWNDSADGPCHLLGLDVSDRLPPIPKHGLRLVYDLTCGDGWHIAPAGGKCNCGATELQAGPTLLLNPR